MRFTSIEDTLNNLNDKLLKINQPMKMETMIDKKIESLEIVKDSIDKSENIDKLQQDEIKIIKNNLETGVTSEFIVEKIGIVEKNSIVEKIVLIIQLKKIILIIQLKKIILIIQLKKIILIIQLKKI